MPNSLDESHPASSATAPISIGAPRSSRHVSAEGEKPGHVTRGVTNRAESRRLGSKANEATWKTIINQMPPHHTYIEPFLGWGAVMLNKAPANHSICIDREEEKVNNFLLELATAHPTMTSGIVNAADAAWRTIGKDAARIAPAESGQQRRLRRGDIAIDESHLRVAR